MQDDPNTLFVRRLEFLSEFVTTLETQFGVLEAMIDHCLDTRNEIQKILFVTIIPAVEQRLILASAQLLEDKSGTNIKKTLNHYRANKRHISHLGKPLTDDEIETLLGLEHLQDQKIRNLRDKALAHLDRQFTDDPQAFIESVGLDFRKDIAQVVSHSQGVLSKLSMATKNSARISIGKVYYAAALNYFSSTSEMPVSKN